jgi:hypothetical protein
MTKKTFNLWNQSYGWGVFIIALFTFGNTVEPTASYWDCAEYIATAAKLQVGHPPGAPFFQMMGAFFALFANSSEQIALMVNYMSVISSAFTILFLFWTITLILKKIYDINSFDGNKNRFTFFGSAAIGSLAFCFSDSFWFNAVEAEVYAMATCLLSILFWLSLRWEEEMNTPKGDRWLLLISFLIGLTFGVHFMALLTIPAMGMLYYFKNYSKITLKGFLLANVISTAILLFIFKLLLPSTLAFFGKSEVFFINNFGLPFNSGTLIAAITIIAFFYFSLRYTTEKKWINLNTGILCTLFVLIGFSSWIMIPIRANANTVINENAPSDARLLLAYYNLEQYPETKLFYGPMFSDIYAGQDDIEPYIDDKPKYERDLKSGRYIIVNHWEKSRVNSNARHRGFLPRLWSSEHAGNYMNFTKPLDFEINSSYRSNQELQNRVNNFKQDIKEGIVSGQGYHDFFKDLSPYLDIEKPSIYSNFKFFVEFQMGYMYWRYFMWNFTGRQNDIQGNYDTLNGNWISGISIIDSIRLGNQKKLDFDSLNNKARNTYFFLPLILGLIGFYFLYKKDAKIFWVLLLLFLFTGIALKVYLNERPFEPRERDYALVGSFYVFAIGIGLGSISLINIIKSYIKIKWLDPLIIVLCFISVPFLMAFQNWDDHDRSDRYTAQSMAKSYLESIQKDAGAMIFTIGDNDTFALWYAQDIEGFRTDVRTINTSLLATDWYIDQMKRKTYESEPIPSQLEHSLYAYGVRDYIRHQSIIDSVRWDVKDFINWVGSDHPRTKYRNLIEQSGSDPNILPKSQQETVFYPTNKIRVTVNKENVLNSGLVKLEDEDQIIEYIDIDLPKSGITKNQLMMLDIIANNDWKRPIYFTGGSYDNSEYIWMKNYLQLEGLVYKLVPIKTKIGINNPYIMGRIDPYKMYNIVTNWKWGNAEDPNIYHDPETRKNSISYRSNMARLVEELIKINENEKAETIIDLAINKMPIDNFGFYSLLVPFVDSYYKILRPEKARKLSDAIAYKYFDRLEYYSSLTYNFQYPIGEEIITEIERYRTLVEATIVNSDKNNLTKTIDNFIIASDPFIYLYGEFEFYTSLIDFVEGYYLGDAKIKAQELSKKITNEYKSRLVLFSQLEEDNQLRYLKRIKNYIMDYSYLVDIINQNDRSSYTDTINLNYEKTLGLFKEGIIQTK